MRRGLLKGPEVVPAPSSLNSHAPLRGQPCTAAHFSLQQVSNKMLVVLHSSMVSTARGSARLRRAR